MADATPAPSSRKSSPPPQQYADVVFEPVPWHRSIFFKLFVILGTASLGTSLLTILLISQVHRLTLTPIIDAAALAAAQQDLITMLLIASGASFLINAALAWLISRSVTAPVRRVVRAMHDVFRNQFNTTIDTRRHDEFGSLALFINSVIAKLRRSRQRDRALSRLKSQFVMVAAHQLRTPLTGLRWSVDWLLSEKGGVLTDKQRQVVTNQLTTTESLMKQINELLQAAELEEGKYRDSLQAIDVAELLTTVQRNFADASVRHSVTFVQQTHVRPGLAIIGDARQLEAALNNLVDNALRYTKPGGTVTLQALQHKDNLTLRLTDTGIGIPAAEQSKLFTKFFRGSHGQTMQPNGSGLGLYITQSIIKNHNGTIAIASQEGRGTTVTVTLPLRRELIPAESFAEGINAL